MDLKTLGAAALVAAGLLASAAPAFAQYYPYPPQPGGGGWGPPDYYNPRPYPPPRRYDDRRYRDDRYYRPQPVIYGTLCVTSRGNCRMQPLPNNASCSCFIPGFGPKRGNILAQGGW